MTTFALVTVIASIIVLAGFLAVSIRRYGLLSSYSAYAVPWDKDVPIHNMHLWSIFTFAIAALFMPALIERGQGNPWQFLGFFVPLYLIMVALFPLEDPKPDDAPADVKRKKNNKIIHVASAICCAVAVVLWAGIVCHLWWVCILSLVIVSFAAYATKSIDTSMTFWGEMALFLTGYTAVLIG